MLIDGSVSEVADIAESVPYIKVSHITTRGSERDELQEYTYLLNGIEDFTQSDREVLFANFSGREIISKNLGDECSEMILTFSDDKENIHYTKCPKTAILDLIDIFERGD